MWLKGEGAADADTQFIVTFEKVPGAAAAGMDFTDMANIGAYPNKKNILFVSQGVIGGLTGGQSVAVMRNWYKIPKGKQRQGLGDFFQVHIAAIGQAIQVCGFATYKEYY